MQIRDLIHKWQKKSDANKKGDFLSYQVQATKLKDSILYFLIQDRENHSIPFTVTHYLSDYSRIGKSPQTIRNIAYALIYLYSFSKYIKLDLNNHITSGNTLEIKEIETLRDFIRTKGKPNILYYKNAPTNYLSVSETNRLMKLIYGYLRWGLENYSNNSTRKIENLERKFANLRYRIKRNNTVRVIKSDSRELLNRAFDIDSDLIWNNPISRLRNHCIYHIAMETGARISEILGLYVGDISTGVYPAVSIIKRDNNILDSRKLKPRVKTFSRSLPISKELHRKILEYLSIRPGKNRCPLLFVSHQGDSTGKPLSIRRTHTLMEDIKRLYINNPKWEKKITWHDVRHTALYQFYWQFKDNPNHKDLLKQVAGHVSDSVFMRYHQLALLEDAQNYLRQLHNKDVQNSYPSLESEISLENLI